MLALLTPDRALKPARLLRRFRPVRLEACARTVGNYSRRARVFSLAQQYFPDLLRKWKADDFWFERYCNFLAQCERAGWFDVDWGTLEIWEVNWMENGNDENTGFDILADYVRGIPVECYGFEPATAEVEYGDESVIHGQPALELLRYLLIGSESGRQTTEGLDNLLAEVGFREEDFDASDETLDRLTRATRRMKPPWCWLPEMARFAADLSGNIILDNTIDPHEPWPCQWTWDKDLETIKAAWVEARPVVEHYKIFVDEVRKTDDLETIYYLAAPKRKRKRK